jgi:hypothetical protein
MFLNKCPIQNKIRLNMTANNMKSIYNIVSKYASINFDDDKVQEIRFNNPKDASQLDELKRKAQQEQEELLRKADEIIRRRQEEAKKLNKDFLLKMQIPGVKENPEK